jgi:hypothetical protein
MAVKIEQQLGSGAGRSIGEMTQLTAFRIGQVTEIQAVV